ncbi:peptidoglycan D,D-transpeptidase FtsI family protein [Pandoraea pnomenusa]|uniref:peptidoglycan D,D-transpeptidase FtsI family protein n=1 Tax=Pandoraea pnomenusa TaxID=93220 RepID=UPI0007BCDFCA|nr:penicillin-binding protein 2 [Pandoraea pnomenusa]ANC43560.1 cell division protein [Pandoraea pnomenusa]
MQKNRQPKDVTFASSPVLQSRTSLWRSKLVVIGITLAFIGLVVRAFWIAGPGNGFYIAQGEKRYEHTIVMPAVRGKIEDRDGRVLATSLPMRTVWAVPAEVPDDLSDSDIRKASKLLDIPPKELRTKLIGEKKFVYVKRQVSPEIGKQVEALGIPGVYESSEYKRFYPEGEVAAHVVGFTNVEDKGQEGMELGEESLLEGTAGVRRVIKDRIGRTIQDLDDSSPPRDGKDIRLTLDTRVQYIAYEALKNALDRTGAKAAMAVVIDAKSGQVLALANLPTYNPNDREHLTGEQLRNRVFTDVFEPGSILKPFTMALALDLHRLTPSTLIDTGPGRYVFEGATISDDSANGVLTAAGVIQKSSNIGMTKVSTMLRAEEMWDMFTEIGLGQQPKLGFPGAVSGRLRPYKSWRRIEQATMAYGYGISASLFQLARAYTIFANDGVLVPISIIKPDTPVQSEGVRVIDARTAAEMRKMLAGVVDTGGTATTAQVAGYSIGGKTGTAYKAGAHGYDHSKYRASFVGIAPLSAPRLVIAVSVDEPKASQHFGGQAAGPAFAEIASQALPLLGIRPDLPVRPGVILAAPTSDSPPDDKGAHG